MLSPRGWATFAWQSDYSQFYLLDPEDLDFLAPEEITQEVLERSYAVPPTGLVVYTADCLQQHIRVAIYDAEPPHQPVDPMTDAPWTRIATATARFPSRRFAISSPSAPTPLPCGPLFLLDTENVNIRIAWKEFQGMRDDSVPIDPDIIDLTIWPA